MKLNTKIANILRNWADKLSPNPWIIPNMRMGIYSEHSTRIEKLCQEQIISSRIYYNIPEDSRSQYINQAMCDMARKYSETFLSRGLIKFHTEMTEQGLRINSYMGVVNLPD